MLPLFSHPCRPEEGVFYGKRGPPSAFDRGSKLITGLAGAESTSGAKEARGDFSERGRGLKRGAGKQSENPGGCDYSPKRSPYKNVAQDEVSTRGMTMTEGSVV